jgi:hypothetical protein
MAHLALGIALRTQGTSAESRREFLAARDLCAFGPRPDERSIIRFQIALTALELDGGRSSHDVFEVIEGQVRELWRLRLLRLGMLRPRSWRPTAAPVTRPSGTPATSSCSSCAPARRRPGRSASGSGWRWPERASCPPPAYRRASGWGC